MLAEVLLRFDTEKEKSPPVDGVHARGKGRAAQAFVRDEKTCLSKSAGRTGEIRIGARSP